MIGCAAEMAAPCHDAHRQLGRSAQPSVIAGHALLVAEMHQHPFGTEKSRHFQGNSMVSPRCPPSQGAGGWQFLRAEFIMLTLTATSAQAPRSAQVS
jgi:hypothetical protein